MAVRNSNARTDSITPTFRGIYLDRFLRLVEGMDGEPARTQRIAVQTELGWCNSQTNGGVDRCKYRATLMVLSDLLGQGWQSQFRQRRIFLTRPDYTHGKHSGLDHALVKDQIRDAFFDERIAKINTPSTQRFIKRMEEPPRGRASILSLVRSGEELASTLERLPAQPTTQEMRTAINPYLQLAKAGVRDPISGLKLLDIWRYFRYLWAIPYQSTPGRNMFYLVRDSARPEHPVIGIAALGNCVVQMSERDQLIGWSVEAVDLAFERRREIVVRDLPKGSAVRRTSEIRYLETDSEYEERVREYAIRTATCIEQALNAELEVINKKGLVTASECSNPTRAVVERLLSIAEESDAARRQELKDAYDEGTVLKRPNGKTRLKDETNSQLYVRKRAEALAEVLSAKLVLHREKFHLEPVTAIRRLLSYDEGRKAIRTGLHSNKKTKIGTSLMDIIVCGAIPPYGEMLGGKLVAMLMTSPQVVRDYSEQYGDRHTQIASRVAGKKIYKASDLVFLTTTSLYHVGSSQYERIRIPAPLGSAVTFDHIGQTEGFGSTTLSSGTVSVLRELIARIEGMQRVNSIFGEGVSPKMRMVRDGLSILGIPQDLVLRHDCPRLIYGVKLAKNAFEYLRGEQKEPEYYFSRVETKEGTDFIVDHWLERWLRNRSKRGESIHKVRHFSKLGVTLSHTVGADLERAAVQELRNVG